MEYFLNLPTSRFNEPEAWALSAENQGWDGICASDHFWVTHAYPHVFVTATRMCSATSNILLTSSFCNNLLRSPVEFSQAALALQQASKGRFEAGLGAGWLEDEITASGLHYPRGPNRMSRYIEALKIARCLLANGQCQFSGKYYEIDITGEKRLGPISDPPPPLVGSVGGPRGIREVSPLVDRVEIKASARGTRGGSMDIATMATVTEEEVKRNIYHVKTTAPGKPVSIFLLVSAGISKDVMPVKAMFGDGFLSQFHGHADEVGEALERLGRIGIDRVQLTEMVPGSQEALAPILLAHRNKITHP